MDSWWEALFRVYGPLGLVLGLVILLIWRKLLPELDQQRREYTSLLRANAEEARKERDYNKQLREREVEKFLESLRIRDERMERGFSEIIGVLRELRNK